MPFCYAVKRIEHFSEKYSRYGSRPTESETTESIHSTLKSANRAALECLREEREDDEDDVEKAYNKDGLLEISWEMSPDTWEDPESVELKVVQEHLHGPDLSLGEVDSESEEDEEIEGKLVGDEGSSEDGSSEVEIIERPIKKRKT